MLLVVALGLNLARATGPATTMINDVVFRANGTPASGTLLLSWPAFTTRDGMAVAAGSMSLDIGASGTVTVLLAPNEGATPTGTYYKVVFKLDDGTTNVEYWTVPAASPTTVSAVRAVVVPAGQAVQVASRQYVDASLAAKASDTTVVHNAGDETIAGVKQFAASPVVPTPTLATQAVNRAYVDSAVSTVQSDFVRRAGDSMTGPLMLSGDPTSSYHASTRHYVDLQLASFTGGLNDKLSRQGDMPVNLAGVRYASAFPNIQAAIADAGTTGAVVIPPTYSGGDSYTNPNNIHMQDLRGKPDREKGFINVVTDCGAVGDGVTDDCSAIQSCINNNAGKHLLFPKMQASQSVDYYSSCTLTMAASRGQWLEGETGGLSNGIQSGGVTIQFAPNTRGMVIPGGCYGCRISNLELRGNDFWTSTSLPEFRTDGTADGISIYGGKARVENVNVQGFSRHGIHIDGTRTVDPSGMPDFWYLDAVSSGYNRGHGLYIEGADSNCGLALNFSAVANQQWGVFDHSMLGCNVYSSPHTATNHRSAVTAGATSNISSISGDGSKLTVVAAANVNGAAQYAWITIAGTTNYNGTYQIASFTDARNFALNSTISAAAESAGTVRTTTSDEAFTAMGIDGGPFKSDRGMPNVILNLYTESDQGGNSKLDGAVLVGGQVTTAQGPDLTYGTYGPLWLHLAGFLAELNTKNGLSLRNGRNEGIFLDFVAGTTTNPSGYDQFWRLRDADSGQTERWRLGKDTVNNFRLIDKVSGNDVIRAAQNGDLALYGPATNGDVNIQLARTGRINFFGDWSSAKVQVLNSGQFVSKVATGTAPFSLQSTTAVANLNADMLDGLHAADFTKAPVAVPATATSTCAAGTWAYDTSYLYVCVAANTWKRAALSSW